MDGRDLFSGRATTFAFSVDDSSITVAFGETRVLAVVAAELEVPRGGHNEGRLTFNVDLSPMASLAFDTVCSLLPLFNHVLNVWKFH